MANDNRRKDDPKDQRAKKDPAQDSYPGNPNRQKQDSPNQQQGGSGAKPDHSRLHEDRSVTDRTVRKSVIDSDNDDDDEIDALKG